MFESYLERAACIGYLCNNKYILIRDSHKVYYEDNLIYRVSIYETNKFMFRIYSKIRKSVSIRILYNPYAVS